MAQVSVPTSTLASGGWIAVPGLSFKHSEIDEGVDTHDGNSTYLYAPNESTSATAVGMGSVTDPGFHTGHKVRWVARGLGAVSKGYKLQLRRTSDNFLIHDTGWKYLGATSFATFESTLTEAEAANITNYGQLAIVFKVLGISSWGGGTIRITAVNFECPKPELIRLTRTGVEVLAQSPEPDVILTRTGIEVLAKAPPDIVLTRTGIEVLASSPGGDIRLTRTGIEVAGVQTYIRVTRTGLEILAESPAPVLRLTRVGLEVLAERIIPVIIRVTRTGLEVLAEAPAPDIVLTRTGLEIAATSPFPKMRITRSGIEILGRRPDQAVTPLPFPSIVPKLFFPNWANPVVLETAWSTDVSRSTEGLEDRYSLLKRPSRTQSVDIINLTDADQAELDLAIMQFSQTRLLVPLYSDQSKLNVAASPSDPEIFCDTTNYRFFNGARLALVQESPFQVEYFIASEVKNGSIILDSGVSSSFAVHNSFVFPILETEVSIEQSGRPLTDRRQNYRLTVHEVPGASALPGLVDPRTPLEDFDYYDGYPVLDMEPNWAANPIRNIKMLGLSHPSGRSTVVSPQGDRPRLGWSLTIMPTTGRAEIFRYLKFFDSRRGRGRTFWIVAPSSLFTAVDVQATHVDVLRHGTKDQVEAFVVAVGLVKKDGTRQVRWIDTVTETTFGGEDVYRLSFESNLDTVPAVADLDRVTWANLVRSEKDSITETWSSTEVCTIKADVLEVLKEEDVTVTHIDLPDPVPTGPPIDVGSLWGWWTCARGAYYDYNPSLLIDPSKFLDEGISYITDYRTVPPNLMSSYPLLEGHTSVNPRFHVSDDPRFAGGHPFAYWGENVTGEGKYFEIVDAQGNVSGPAHDNTNGLTVFVCYRKGKNAISANHYLYWREDVLLWTDTKVDIYENLGADNKGFSYSALHGNDDADTRIKSILVLTWSPGTYCRVYQNGVLHAQASQQVTDLPNDDVARHRVMRNNITQLSDEEPYDCYCMGPVLIFSKALSTAELNTIGNYLESLWAPHTTWRDIP